MLKAFFLLGLIFVKNTAIAAEQFFPEQPLYEWLAQSQSMSESSLVSINPALINKRFVSVEKISNATPLIKYYADVLIKEGDTVTQEMLEMLELEKVEDLLMTANEVFKTLKQILLDHEVAGEYVC